MTRVLLGLLTRDGDRLGHLVRAVQMLRSYGNEAKIMRYSDVMDWCGQADEPPAMCCMLECMSDADMESLSGIARETQWALGDEDKVLQVYIMQYGNERFQEAPPPLQALLEEKTLACMSRVEEGHEFAQMCDWGQQFMGEDVPVVGEWPSATGQ
ncbi:MAG: hypothetical protein K0R39_4156 [Symbiobacteriaceae bacterium]|jgi:hypothetical protein|nr:hypothetical protein [Symbiobacteriaceae bacterium]